MLSFCHVYLFLSAVVAAAAAAAAVFVGILEFHWGFWRKVDKKEIHTLPFMHVCRYLSQRVRRIDE